MRRSYRSRRAQAHALTDIPLTPLIDTALTLLIIFMVTTPMIQHGIRVTLPKGQAKEDGGAKQEFIVFIDKENHYFFNGKEYAPEELVKVVHDKVGVKKDKTVFVKADQSALCGKVFELVDQIKVIAGVQYVVFSTQRRA